MLNLIRPEHILNDLRVDTLDRQQRSCCVAQVVGAMLRDIGAFENSLEPLRDVAPVKRRTDARRKHKIVNPLHSSLTVNGRNLPARAGHPPRFGWAAPMGRKERSR